MCRSSSGPLRSFIVHFQRGELAVAHEAARELLRAAEDRGETAARVAGHRIVGSALCHLGRLAESRAQLEAALGLYDAERDRGSAFVYALDSRVVCLFWLVHVLLALGYPERARARMREGLAHARGLGHPYTLAYALSVACLFHGRHRPGPEARTEADALVALAAEQGFPLPAAVGTVLSGWALTGEDGAAEEGNHTVSW
jgi:predicted ATPase